MIEPQKLEDMNAKVAANTQFPRHDRKKKIIMRFVFSLTGIMGKKFIWWDVILTSADQFQKEYF